MSVLCTKTIDLLRQSTHTQSMHVCLIDYIFSLCILPKDQEQNGLDRVHTHTHKHTHTHCFYFKSVSDCTFVSRLCQSIKTR